MRLAQQSTMALLWEVDLSLHHCSQPLLLFLPLFTESWVPCPTFILWGRFRVPPHPQWQCYITIHCLCFSVLLGVGFNLPRGCTELHSWGVGRGVCVVHFAHLLGLQVYAGSLETGQQGEMVYRFSQGRHFLGLGSVWRGIERLSTGYRSSMSQSLILVDALSSA
jgi:hypothetical protein